MGYDVECPYCGNGEYICHDDGFGYTEGVRHEMQCNKCEKTFVFETSISFYYHPEKADCLNGSPHNLKDVIYQPKNDDLTWVRCQDCDYEKRAMKETSVNVTSTVKE